MPGIPDSHADLVGAPHFAHLATINEDGSPQSTPVWVARDGDDVLLVTDAGYRKAQNIRRNPSVAISIHDESNPYRYIQLRGRGRVTPVEGWDFLDARAKEYMDQPEYPYKRDEARLVLVRISVDHVATMG